MSQMDEKRMERCFEEISQFKPNPEVTARDLDRANEKLAELTSGQRTKDRKIWRIIMKSRITKLAAAAVIIIAGLTASHYLGGSIDGTTVAWAKVAQIMENFPAHVHRQSRIVMCDGKKIEHLSSDNVITHFLPGVGYREDMYDQQGQLMLRIYGLLPRKTSITVIPILRQYKVETLSDDQLSAFNMGFPRIVECIKSGDYKELGRKVIKGKDTEGIEFTNPFLVIHTGYPLRFDELLFRVWVDVRNSFPVYMEIEATSSDKFLTLWTGGRPLHIKAVVEDIQWDVDIDPKELEPDVPDDFTLISSGTDSYDESKATLGLKAFAEVTQGRYPNNLHMIDVLIDGADAILKRLGDNAWLGSHREQAEVLWRRVICTKATCLFYDELLREDKDVAYFGDTVTARNSDAVLMRWKISDGQYRVIFGNLTARDVSTAQLAELEGASSRELQYNDE